MTASYTICRCVQTVAPKVQYCCTFGARAGYSCYFIATLIFSHVPFLYCCNCLCLIL